MRVRRVTRTGAALLGWCPAFAGCVRGGRVSPVNSPAVGAPVSVRGVRWGAFAWCVPAYCFVVKNFAVKNRRA